ncbi:hypothetical protein PG989_000938 [Apiospora arundinis]
MENKLEVYQGRFAAIQTALTDDVDRGVKLMEELLSKLTSTEKELHKAELDLENESKARRDLQQERKEWKERQERRPFVAVIIDADADEYAFGEDLLTRGEKGGVEAADALLSAVQGYAQGTVGVPEGTNITVRAYANLNGLKEALQRRKFSCDFAQLRAFASGFNNRQALFDFVDVGSGKERADSKIRENISFFVDSFQCKHLMLACGHDTGYAPFLGQFVGNKHVVERITLIKGRSQLPPDIQKLELKTTQFDAVFKGLSAIATFTQVAGTVWGHTPNIFKPSAQLTQGEGLKDMKPRILKTQSGFTNPAAQSSRLGPVIRDNKGHRVDKSLQPDRTVVDRIRRGKLCYSLYLRGECAPEKDKCANNHVHRPLETVEFDALWWLARTQTCYANWKDRTGNGCADDRCIYGHGTPM